MSETLTATGRWVNSALCSQADPDTVPRQRQLPTRDARQVDLRCPIRAQCLDYALSGADTWRGITSGIWAGTTPKERAALRRQRPRKAAAA